MIKKVMTVILGAFAMFTWMYVFMLFVKFLIGEA